MRKTRKEKRGSQHGFSIIEMVLAAGLISALSFGAILSYQNLNLAFSATSAKQIVSAKLRLARQLAITQRRNVTVTFASPNLMQLTAGQTTPFEVQELPAGFTYDTPSGAPAAPCPAIVDLKNKSIIFLGDGSVQDPTTGDPVNGVIFLYSPISSNVAASAVTVMGSSGYVREYNLNADNNTWE